MKNIYYHKEDVDFTLDNEEQTTLWLQRITQTENKQIDELNYIFCSDEYLLKVNIEHLSHDYYTDVITFDYCENNSISGDVFISVDRVKDNAKTYSKTFENELKRVMAHGLLHLMGYKDKTPADEQKMREMEEKALKLFDFS